MDGHSKEIWSGKTKEIMYRAVNFCTVTTNFFEEIGKIRFNSVNSRKNCSKMDKIDKVYKSQN
jgi:hypothetical protein